MISSLKTFVSDSFDPYYNLATEEFLTFSVGANECILYLWQNRNTVVIGKNQNAYRECNVTKLEEDGGHLARRLSGGGAVYHDDGNLNFTFCVRKDNYDLKKQLSVIVEAVNSFGVKAMLTGRNDITVDEKKFSGNAYYESGEYAYHHGCIMINANKENLSSYLNVSEAKLKSKGVSSVKSRVMNLSEASSAITVQSLKNALMVAFTKVYGYDYDMITLSEGDKAKIDELRNKYASEEWRFGQKIPFTQTIENRFSFGEVQLHLDVNEGRINAVRVNTDAMDTSISEKTEEALTGAMYRKEELLAIAKDKTGEVSEILLYLCEII